MSTPTISAWGKRWRAARKRFRFRSLSRRCDAGLDADRVEVLEQAPLDLAVHDRVLVVARRGALERTAHFALVGNAIPPQRSQARRSALRETFDLVAGMRGAERDPQPRRSIGHVAAGSRERETASASSGGGSARLACRRCTGGWRRASARRATLERFEGGGQLDDARRAARHERAVLAQQLEQAPVPRGGRHHRQRAVEQM